MSLSKLWYSFSVFLRSNPGRWGPKPPWKTVSGLSVFFMRSSSRRSSQSTLGFESTSVSSASQAISWLGDEPRLGPLIESNPHGKIHRSSWLWNRPGRVHAPGCVHTSTTYASSSLERPFQVLLLQGGRMSALLPGLPGPSEPHPSILRRFEHTAFPGSLSAITALKLLEG